MQALFLDQMVEKPLCPPIVTHAIPIVGKNNNVELFVSLGPPTCSCVLGISVSAGPVRC